MRTAPTAEILTTAEAKTHLREDLTDATNDTYIDALVTAARAAAEQYTGLAFLDQTWDYVLDEAHPVLASESIELPLGPVQSITSIDSYADDNTATAFSSAAYYLNVGDDAGYVTPSTARVSLVDGNDWPTDMRRYHSIEIRFLAGFGDEVADIPAQWREPIKRACLLTVAALYQNRGDDRPGGAFKFGLTETSRDLLYPLKRYSL